MIPNPHTNPRHPMILEVKNDTADRIRELEREILSREELGVLRQRTIKRLTISYETAMQGLRKAREVGRSRLCLTEERYVIEQTLAKLEDTD